MQYVYIFMAYLSVWQVWSLGINHLLSFAHAQQSCFYREALQRPDSKVSFTQSLSHEQYRGKITEIYLNYHCKTKVSFTLLSLISILLYAVRKYPPEEISYIHNQPRKRTLNETCAPSWVSQNYSPYSFPYISSHTRAINDSLRLGKGSGRASTLPQPGPPCL